MVSNLEQGERGRTAVPGTGRTRPRVRCAAAAVALVAASGVALAGCGAGAPGTPRGSVGPAADRGSAAPATGTDAGTASGTPETAAAPPASTAGAADSADSGAPTAGTASPAPSASVGARAADGGRTAAAPAGVSRCHTSQLRASVGPEDPGAGQENYALVLTNTSGRTCTVHGFPGFAFVDSSGRQVTQDPQRVGGQKQTVRLAPGHSAWAALGFPNPGVVGGRTATPAEVRITPPDETAYLTVSWKGGPVSEHPPAAGAPHVGPFQPRTGPGTPSGTSR
ncbi:DUF4232 domain-containing protein [Streptomyces sp. NPDC047002]|uniref:DUF4232 domain-containing protein n=1 Tax=Streptomyces sp. NPDC047002 TaxID=3155475 RepID=UPI003455C5A1